MNRGAVETKRAMEARDLGVNRAAATLGTDPGNLGRILREENGRKPGRELALRIRDEFGVGPDLWDIPVPVENPNPEQPAKPAA